eukprot:366207-Chlamydomonas_euryale.AAC.2
MDGLMNEVIVHILQPHARMRYSLMHGRAVPGGQRNEFGGGGCRRRLLNGYLRPEQGAYSASAMCSMSVQNGQKWLGFLIISPRDVRCLRRAGYA